MCCGNLGLVKINLSLTCSAEIQGWRNINSPRLICFVKTRGRSKQPPPLFFFGVEARAGAKISPNFSVIGKTGVGAK